MQLNGAEIVSYNAGNLTAGGAVLGSAGDYPLNAGCNNLNMNNAVFTDYYYHYYPTWYPTYHICEKSKVEQAFKILGKILEQKIIERELTVKEFMKMVNDIAEII
jgi:hypothetical protein